MQEEVGQGHVRKVDRHVKSCHAKLRKKDRDSPAIKQEGNQLILVRADCSVYQARVLQAKVSRGKLALHVIPMFKLQSCLFEDPLTNGSVLHQLKKLTVAVRSRASAFKSTRGRLTESTSE
eukprot:TRINITY_DN12020_c1_g5_i1.p1 TRINITY_DN12020_c1_g5~~TRINITY_DN12020_c1_g5_i1.p1  ORF type:complete len:121 (+),score=2.63 TRINITY_DN12020_c1_g5_i1:110-472(+)